MLHIGKEEYYSIWLMPTGNIYYKFARIITQLSKEYSSPSFEPHVTLLTRILASEEKMLIKTEKLASSLKPLEVQLTTLEYLDYYFRALFVKVVKTSQILKAYRKAIKLFGIKNPEEYMPHLSLLYGDFPESVKRKIIKKIGTNFKSEFEAQSLHLVRADYKAIVWHPIKEFPLKRSRDSGY